VTLSALDMFTIGVGPSSSHTVGPMRAARSFAVGLEQDGLLPRVERVVVELFGSLGATGVGHGSDTAVLLGLEGEEPETVATDGMAARADAIRAAGGLALAGDRVIAFDARTDLLLHRAPLPAHPNGMRFHAFDAEGRELRSATSYSVGGGFVVDDAVIRTGRIEPDAAPVPFPFATAEELLEHCRREGASISTIALANETVRHPEAEVRRRLLEVWTVMQACVEHGCERTEPLLPGRLGVPRRAPRLFDALRDRPEDTADGARAMDWVNLFALAVNEENASGGRVVTAPTNGAAGIVPAVLHYYARFVPGATEDGVVRFLLTAASIGMLLKQNASISGAEVGCQGEVGSACAMAAAGLCEVLGGSPDQVENAAEIGIEHNLGLTCDPVGGLVQIPCIERNAIASNTAINAARIARYGDGTHKVSLDVAIRTMAQTGADMKSKYKETSLGGLAVNVVEC
jgi:L-serine dehydratase